VSRTKQTVSGCMVAAPTGAIHHYYLEEKVMEEWQGEISIEKYLKEIKEMLKKLVDDVDKIKDNIRDINDEQDDGKWDYWGNE